MTMMSQPSTQQSSDPDINQFNQLHQNKVPRATNGAGGSGRDQSIDVLRGLCCFGMILVNTAGPVRPMWLTHPVSIHQPITFADTLFPCFVFTSGLALAQQKGTGTDNKLSSLKKSFFRAMKLNLIGIAYNLIPRVIGFQQNELFDFKTYRIPSVLGRLGIASFVCSLESFFNIKPPIFATSLGLSWYLISSLRPFEPFHQSSQAWLDQTLFGSSHLYNRRMGFDPEGLLGSLFTTPISCLLGSYAARHNVLAIRQIPQLATFGILGMLLTGLLSSPSCKMFWSPTFVGQTTFSSLVYWSISLALVRCPNQLTRLITHPLEILGQRSLEVYLISTCGSTALARIGIWDSIFHHLNFSLNIMGFHHDPLRKTFVGLIRSSLLGMTMVPFAAAMIELNWKL